MPPSHSRQELEFRAVVGDVTETSLWLWLIPVRPLSGYRAQALALGAIIITGAARWASLPLLGSDISFVTAIPAVLVATLIGGAWAGSTALVAGAVVDLVFSIAIDGRSIFQATPRLAAWLAIAALVMVIAMGLRSALVALRVRERQLSATSDQLRLVARELEHRGRNTLAVVRAISDDSARSASSVSDYRALLASRLTALAGSYSLSGGGSEPVDLFGLVAEVLKPFGGRLRIEAGAPCQVLPAATLPLTLAIHELATNAVKYGALSRPTGHVVVSWVMEPDSRVTLRWAEYGGPAPKLSSPEGFGSTLLRKAFAGVPGGRFGAEWAASGLVARIQLQCARRADARLDPARGGDCRGGRE